MLIKSKSPYLPDDVTRLIKFFRQHPDVAANQLLVRDGQPLTLMPIQKVILHDWWNSKFSILTASRGTGKTFLAAVYAALKLLLYPNERIGIFAPSFRQSKLIFTEFKRLHDDSRLLAESVYKEPTFGNDSCTCIFKPAGKGISQSFVKALPIGTDGGKIRGERFGSLLIDEIVHLPETIYRSSLKPMLSTVRNPAQRVKHLKELREQYGDSLPDEFLSTDNGYIGITSGYYQFNYWWQEISSFYNAIKAGNKLYSLRFVPYWSLPEGFFEMDVVRDAEQNDPKHVFQTEWCAEWIPDSDGAFPMSLLEACRVAYCKPKLSRGPGDSTARYVIGIDPGRERDATGIVVVELGSPCKVVNVIEVEDEKFQEQAKTVLKLARAYNPERIYMDAGGGGLTIRDLLSDPGALGFSVDDKIIPHDADINFKGRRLLYMCDFLPIFIQDANNAAKLLLENRSIVLPNSMNPILGTRTGTNAGKREIDLVQEMINQIAAITITQTGNKGMAHYDLPRKQSESPLGQVLRRKDLYSGFILACKAIYDLEFRPKADNVIIQEGVVSEIKVNKPEELATGMSTAIMGGRYFPAEVERAFVSQQVMVPGGGIILSRNVNKKK